MITNNFAKRHNGPQAQDVEKMLKTIGVSSIEELIDKTIPKQIRLKNDLNLPLGMNEFEYLNHIKTIASKNKIYKSYIGQGYYNTILPAVLQRNILENPGWYTSYTPYQAEISQGRLEALFTYQTLVASMTAMPLTNCSLLDEATADAEAMLMFYHSRSRQQQKDNVNKFFVDENLFAQCIEVIKTRALPKDITLVIGNAKEVELDNTYFGAIVQYIGKYGQVENYKDFISKAKEQGVRVAIACDLMSLALLTPPGEMGADAVTGTSQRFGNPMGFGGPNAAFLATTDEFKRNLPGRIIGQTVDMQGNKAFRLALQTREQHIKREKATSNICTATALMAIVSAMYACYHGAEGIKEIALDIHSLAKKLACQAKNYGYEQKNKVFFDTLCFQSPVSTKNVQAEALKNEMNFNYIDDNTFSISLDETTSLEDVNNILLVLAKANGKEFKASDKCCCDSEVISNELKRTSAFMTEKVFSLYHSETEMMRYLKKLEVKDLSLNRAMIPLGSCTMKLNAAMEMIPFTWPEFASIHPFAPENQALGYKEMISNLNDILAEVTGFAKVCFQPNSGAAGEYAGLTTIRNYQIANGQANRTLCLIPASAHGTNPASAAMAGMDIIVVKSTEDGEIDVEDLRQKAEENKDRLSCLMITYPSTHGVFEERILDIVNIIHSNGGLVYMDGANMNAQVGWTGPGYIGADVCHMNLHKTFAMPHGGGGPGVGPIACSKELVEYLPTEKKGTPVSATPFGSAMLLPITYAYLKLLGRDGLKEATAYAILNANYMRCRLKDHYNILYHGSQGMCAHEFILDCNQFSLTSGVQCGDIAKRLMDYGFHAPTVAFPVHGTLMIEPTESEPLSEIDRLCDALIQIRKEVKEIEEGRADKKNNLIMNAPHTMQVICADDWDRPYTRQQAAFPLPYNDKYWPMSGKVDDAFGDRNLVIKWQE
ncbi:MAG: aminomethyl-transferring glycine dehydrogenase [Bacteroidota bacterium]|nr:aminomethyl-transferring glycine dehydrogenase [Bacteroidota bacterium]